MLAARHRASSRLGKNVLEFCRKIQEEQPKENPTGISQVISSYPGGIAKVTYYSLNGTLLSAPQKGINIRKMLFQNGKTIVDKVVKE